MFLRLTLLKLEKRDNIAINNNLTVTRGEVEEIMGGQEGTVFRNNYKGHMDKTKEGWNQGRVVEGSGGG